MIKPNQIYKHFKGNYYTILELGVHTETGEEMVIYKDLYDDKVWVRPLNMFLEKVDKVKYPNVKQEYRFELIENGDLNERN